MRALAVRAAMPALLFALALMALRLVTWPIWSGISPGVRLGFAALILALLALALIGAAIAQTGARFRNLIAWVGITGSLGAATILDSDYTHWQYRHMWDAAPVETGLRGASPGRAVALDNGDIVLTRQINGHYYVDAEINGVAVDFLVDTGASGVALTLDDARRIGIRIDRLDYSVTVSEASAISVAAPVTIRTLVVAGQRFDDVPALVMRGGDRSLLGMSVLERFRSIEIRSNQLILRS